VQYDAGEECQDKTNTSKDGSPIALHLPVTRSYPGNQNKKAGVNIDVNARKASQFPGPFHLSIPFGLE
jgi:hypothetical protein